MTRLVICLPSFRQVHNAEQDIKSPIWIRTRHFQYYKLLHLSSFSLLPNLLDIITMEPSVAQTERADFIGFEVKKPHVAPNALTVSERLKATEVRFQSLGKAKDGRLLKIREHPKFATLEEERVYRKQHLAAAFRIFADRGFDEGVAGHIFCSRPNSY